MDFGSTRIAEYRRFWLFDGCFIPASIMADAASIFHFNFNNALAKAKDRMFVQSEMGRRKMAWEMGKVEGGWEKWKEM